MASPSGVRNRVPKALERAVQVSRALTDWMASLSGSRSRVPTGLEQVSTSLPVSAEGSTGLNAEGRETGSRKGLERGVQVSRAPRDRMASPSGVRNRVPKALERAVQVSRALTDWMASLSGARSMLTEGRQPGDEPRVSRALTDWMASPSGARNRVPKALERRAPTSLQSSQGWVGLRP